MSRVGRWLRHPAAVRPAYLLCWVAYLWSAWVRFDHARHEFDDPRQADAHRLTLARLVGLAPDADRPPASNTGHAQIDFGGQWVMARQFLTDGRHLYHRDHLRRTVEAAFPPDQADDLMDWFVGDDPPAGDGVGGPLYPPVHGLLYAPLGRLDPQPAYRLFQTLTVGFALFAGLAISRATGGRVWWPVAAVGVLLFPGFRGGIDLGQNHALTLAVLAGGWWGMSRGRWVLGGTIWGLLAFKPVWAVAVLPVPLLMGQWRASAAMAASAGALVLLTLPVVGVQAWFDWLAVGGRASAVYGVNANWVGFSRDLAGLPRRLWIDFGVPEAERGSRRAAAAGWLLLAIVLGATATIYRLQPDRRPAGLAAGFLLLGAYLGCYRFMYYDATLAVLPLALVLADPRAVRAWRFLALVAALYGYENWLIHHSFEVTVLADAVEGRDVAAKPGRRVLTLAGNYRYAWDTALLLAVWAWAGLRLVADRHTKECVQGGPDVGRPHERLADQHG